jgi:hypothetical protein
MPEFKTRQEYLKWKEERAKNPSAAPPGAKPSSRTNDTSGGNKNPAGGRIPPFTGGLRGVTQGVALPLEAEAALYAAKVREITAAIKQEADEQKLIQTASDAGGRTPIDAGGRTPPEASAGRIFQCPACQGGDVVNAQSYLAPADASGASAQWKSPLSKKILKYRPRPAALFFRFDNRGFTEDKVELMRFAAAGVFILAGGFFVSVALSLILFNLGALLMAIGALFFLVRQYGKFRAGRCLERCNPTVCAFDKSQRNICAAVENINIDKMRAAMLDGYFQDMKARRESLDAARRWNDLYLCRRCETLFDVRTRDVRD